MVFKNHTCVLYGKLLKDLVKIERLSGLLKWRGVCLKALMRVEPNSSVIFKNHTCIAYLLNDLVKIESLGCMLDIWRGVCRKALVRVKPGSFMKFKNHTCT